MIKLGAKCASLKGAGLCNFRQFQHCPTEFHNNGLETVEKLKRKTETPKRGIIWPKLNKIVFFKSLSHFV